ncbi:MAG: deoxyribonuclease IV [Defluviitaleaceae bacterium]|nr:deoxyribonuclease IV [Defluviitaleaceae bacterium]
MLIGSHVSISDGLLGAAKEAVSYGANTFMVYTGAPQNTRRKSLDKLKIPEGLEYMKEHGINEIVVHAPYIVNLASPNSSTYELAIEFLAEEIRRAEAFKSPYIVVHPGAYTDSSLDEGIERIANALNKILSEDTNITICLETMVGKGTEIGKTFEELRDIIDRVDLKEKMAVCLDTCHAHDSGYDIINDFDGVMGQFDKVLSLDKLKVFHLNGSLNARGARKDRHANLGANEDNPRGKDHIGFETICKIAHSKYAEGRPLILETPWLDAKTNLYREEIAALKAPGGAK